MDKKGWLVKIARHSFDIKPIRIVGETAKIFNILGRWGDTEKPERIKKESLGYDKQTSVFRDLKEAKAFARLHGGKVITDYKDTLSTLTAELAEIEKMQESEAKDQEGRDAVGLDTPA